MGALEAGCVEGLNWVGGAGREGAWVLGVGAMSAISSARLDHCLGRSELEDLSWAGVDDLG